MKGIRELAKCKKKPEKPIQHDLFGDPIEESSSKKTSSVQKLYFGTFNFRMILINGEPWWVLSDVARILGYRDAEQAKRLLRDKHRGTTLSGTPGVQPGQIIVNEAGLYRLMMRSDKPEAEQFQDWITEEVLPQIRKTGSYQSGPTDRIAKKMKQLRCDQELATKRVEGIDLSKALAAAGQSPHASAIHNVVYRGQFDGKDAKTLKDDLGLKAWETPLDHMDLHLTIQNSYIKSLAAETIKAKDVESKDRLAVYEEMATQVITTEKEKLGPSLRPGIHEDPKRGKLLALVSTPIELASQSSPAS